MKNSAILLINCPDRKGIVAAVANFLYQYGANILHADQHQDSNLNLFFQRVEWDLTDFDLNADQFRKKFTPIARDFRMHWNLTFSKTRLNVAIFVSKEDHCLADLLYRYQSGELNCDIQLVISNHNEAKKITEFYKIPFHKISVNPKDKKEVEQSVITLLKKNKIDLVVLARYMQILSGEFIKYYPHRIINIHHSFLPAFIGARPYHQAYERGVKIIGATSHYVTTGLDNGPIIEQDVIRISHRDSVGDMIQKGRDLEKVVLSRAVKWYLEGRILVYANKTVVFD